MVKWETYGWDQKEEMEDRVRAKEWSICWKQRGREKHIK